MAFVNERMPDGKYAIIDRKNGITLIHILIVAAILILISFFLYIPENERDFLEKIKNEFEVSGRKISPHEEEILLNNVTDFNWDRVCWASDDIYLLGPESDVNADYLGKKYEESDITHLNTSNPKFYSAFVFVFEEKPVKVFQFGRFYTLNVRGKNYSLSYVAHPFIEYKSNYRDGIYLPCFSRGSARLKADFHLGRIILGGE